MIDYYFRIKQSKDRNAIGAREINNYYTNGYARKTNIATNTYANNNQTNDNNSNTENHSQTKGNKIEQFFNMIFKKNNNNENSAKKMKIISKNDVVAIATIGDSKYNLYPTKDVEITATQRPNLNYTINLNSGVNKKSVGKVVGTYVATDGTLTYSGELIMK